MSEFHFLRPFWLLALLPVALLSWRFYRLGRAGGDWRQVCDPALLPYILVHGAGSAPTRRASLLLGLGGVLATLALAGPVWERLPTPAFRNDAALVIALDLSRIMEAADLKPSRLERARFKIADILKQRKDGLTALLVYSGDAFTVTPLTDDAATIASQLPALTSDLMPAQGSRAERALALAGRLLKQAGLARGDVLLITNGGSLGKGAEAAQALRGQGYRVSVLGAGGEEGAPVPLAEGGFLQDTKGNIVISKLAAPALRQLAEQGGGMYRKLTADGSDLADLLGFFEQQAQPGEAGAAGAAGGGVAIEQWEERGPWLLLPLLPIAALAFRRGLLVVLALLVLPLPQPAQALAWQDLWQTRDQQASQAFQAGQAAQAAETFENPAWKAAAEYKAGQYAEAAKTLEAQESADAHYNRGNALAKLGQYPQALAAYEQALKQDPGNEDARHNKELVEKALKEQQQQQKDKEQKNQDKQGQEKQDKEGKQDKEKPNEAQNQKQDKSQGKEGEPKPPEEPGKPAQAPQKPQEQQAGQDGQKPPAEQQQQRQAAGEKPEERQAKSAAQAAAEAHEREAQQANEQWLQRIPDDPGGLLRRKFLYQYQQRQKETQ
jgi:Ca-activated chloride channel family protein